MIRRGSRTVHEMYMRLLSDSIEISNKQECIYVESRENNEHSSNLEWLKFPEGVIPTQVDIHNNTMNEFV